MLVGERERRLYLFRPEQVEYIESHGNYVKLHSGGGEYLGRNSIKSLGGQLGRVGFLRVSRTVLINLDALVYAQRKGRGVYAFTLTSGETLSSSRRFRAHILRFLPLGQTK